MASEVKIEIPTILIQDTIRAEMMRSLGNTDQLVEAVIKHAMNEKKDTYNSTPTYFQHAVNEMIRNIAKDIFSEWLEQNRENIKKALLKFLTENKQKMLTDLATQLASNITTYGINVSLTLRDPR